MRRLFSCSCLTNFPKKLVLFDRSCFPIFHRFIYPNESKHFFKRQLENSKVHIYLLKTSSME